MSNVLMTIFFTVLLIAVLTIFCALLAFIAPGLSTTLMTEKAREAAQIPDPDKRQKIRGYTLYVLAGIMFVAVLIWAGIDGVHSKMTWWRLWLRFFIMFLAVELYDDIFLDWFIFTKTGFFGYWVRKITGRELPEKNTEPQWDGKEKRKLIAVPFGTLILALIFIWIVR